MSARRLTPLWDLGEIPFQIGPRERPSNDPFPDRLPFVVGVDELGVVVQMPNAEVSRQLAEVYRRGCQIGTPMDDQGLGKCYGEDFFEFLRAHLPDRPAAELEVLEIGCGSGYLLRKFKQLGARVTGVEPDRRCAAQAAREGIRVIADEFRAERFEQRYTGDLPTWRSESWARWRDVKNRVPHVQEAVWVNDYLARDAADWARASKGIVWYEHAAFGAMVAKLADAPLHTGGPKAEARILAEKGDRSIVASINSHGEGRNGLQFLFAEQLVTWPPASGKEWEQFLGRLHRRGQRADVVYTYVYRHVPEMRESIDRAVRLAKFVEGLTSANQRLLGADVEWAL